MQKKILYGVIIIASILALGVSTINRMSIERESKAYELVLDYYETQLLAEQSNQSIEHWFKKFSEWGATYVALDEETLSTMVEQDHRPIKYRSVSEIQKDYSLMSLYPQSVQDYLASEKVDSYDLIVQTPSKLDYERILQGLESRYTSAFYTTFEFENNYIVVMNGTPEDVLYTAQTPIYDSFANTRERSPIVAGSKLEQVGLGYNPSKIQMIKNAGLSPMPRPKNHVPFTDKLVDAYFNDLVKYDMVPEYIIFSGTSVVGYEDTQANLQDLIDQMRRHKIAVGMVETGVQRQYVEQDGIDLLAEHMEYDVVRVFPVVKYIQQRFKYYNYSGAEEIENTIYRAVSERNIRSVYFRPFLLNDSKYVTDEREYEKMFDGLAKRLETHGYVMGKVGHFEYNNPQVLSTALLASGIIAIGVLFLKLLIPAIPNVLEMILLLGGVFASFPASYIAPNLMLTVFSLLAAILFPSLSILLLMSYGRQKLASQSVTKIGAIIREGGLLLVVCIGVSMLGGLYIANLLSHSKYLIEMEIFRGVKLSQIAPMGIFFVIYLLKFGFRRERDELQGEKIFYQDVMRILNENIKVVYVIAASAVALVGIVYIARTGHETSLQPSTFEMIFRNFLENELLARPRTKEFMLGFPAVIAFAFIAHRGYRKLILPLGLFATIGFASVANTFSHLRTPLYLSLYRTSISIPLGFLIGVFSVLILQLLLSAYGSYRGKKQHE